MKRVICSIWGFLLLYTPDVGQCKKRMNRLQDLWNNPLQFAIDSHFDPGATIADDFADGLVMPTGQLELMNTCRSD